MENGHTDAAAEAPDRGGEGPTPPPPGAGDLSAEGVVPVPGPEGAPNTLVGVAPQTYLERFLARIRARIASQSEV